MPNWTTNKIRVEGRGAVEFVRNIFNESFSFNDIIPEPTTPKECEAKFVLKDAEDARSHFLAWDETNDRRWFNWYDWHREKWGTKWDICSDDLYVNENQVQFPTAWSAPIPVLLALSKKYPQYTFYIKCIFEDSDEVLDFALKDGQEY